MGPAGKDGYRWSYSCGEGSGDKKCDPTYQARGKCFWDGTKDDSIANQSTRELQWSKNALDCIMWTACGVQKNGQPVMIEHKDGSLDLVQREIPAVNTKNQKFNVADSVYIYGHVTDITRESIDSTRSKVKYSH